MPKVRQSYRFSFVVITTAIALMAIAEQPAAADAISAFDPSAVMPAEQVPIFAVEPINVDAVVAEDHARDAQNLPWRFAMPHETALTPNDSGTWESLPEGGWVWRLRISAPDAHHINLGFDRYRMPPGAQLHVTAMPEGDRLGPYTADDNHDHGQLWLPIVRAEELIITVQLPDGTARAALDLRLAHVGYGYRGFGSALEATPRSDACQVDVVCPEGTVWANEIPAVGVYTLDGIFTCSGVMMNNTAQNQAPLFLTAEHCGITSTNDASMVVYWNFQNSTCREPGSPQSGAPGNGQLNQSTSGATLLASAASTDFAIVQLDDSPDATWGVTYAGWDRTNTDPPSVVGIHHPSTDEKRISFEDHQTATTSEGGFTSPGDGNFIIVNDWDLGTTEPGSSGSPIFNPEHRVVGVLCCGGSECGFDFADWYGRLSRSWTGGSPETRLSDWLDPIGTNVEVLDTLVPTAEGFVAVSPNLDALHTGLPGGPFTTPQIVYTIANPGNTQVDYNVMIEDNFGLLLDGGTVPVTGTLNGGINANRQITVSLAPATNDLAGGTHVARVVFQDLSNNTQVERIHTIEIGKVELCSQTAPMTIPDDDNLGVQSSLVSLTGGIVTDLDVEVNITHGWIGDVVVQLRHVDSGTNAFIIDQIGGSGFNTCFESNISGAILDDEGTGGPIEVQCTSNLTSPPAYVPQNPLSVFDGLNLQGTWTLRVVDPSAGIQGQLLSWCMTATVSGDGGGGNNGDDDPAPIADIDGDGVADDVDNCPEIANADQLDINANGTGDVCETQLTLVDCPTEVTVPANTATGATVDFELPTTVGGFGAIEIVSIPSPGSTFPIGTTRVNITVFDATRASASCEFDVIVTAANPAGTNPGATSSDCCGSGNMMMMPATLLGLICMRRRRWRPSADS